MIEWTGLWTLAARARPRAEGVNHVAFGVADMEAQPRVLRRLGFDEMLFESTDFFDPMAPWYDRRAAGPAHGDDDVGAGRRRSSRCVLTPLGPDCRGEWGHLGPMEFAVGVTNLERASRSSQAAGVERGRARTVDVGTGEWRSAYFGDPDGLYVSLVEPRY